MRLLAEVAGRSQSFFLKQLIEKGIGAMENAWLPQQVVAYVRSGALLAQQHGATLDLFGDQICEQRAGSHNVSASIVVLTDEERVGATMISSGRSFLAVSREGAIAGLCSEGAEFP